MTPTREDLELYLIGEYDGDTASLEAAIAADPASAAVVAEEARFELLLRDAATAATFCPACSDLVRGERCDACGAALTPGGYTVERVLVSNAHGRMYVARDADGTQVALKELAFVQSPTLAMIAAFEREAKFLRALAHPAIPRFVASFEEGSGVHVRYYLAQELVTGESLDARLEEHWFTESEILDLARQVLGVLVYLQSLSPMVIHRDVKPANLLRRADGTIAVVDFGAAHVQGTTAGSTSIGTFGYMPIEQLAGLVDATTDPYALGASLLHLLSRREPWRILQGVSLEGINVSPALRSFLSKLVAPEPRDRFANAAAALAALERVARGEMVTPVARRRATWWRPLAVAAASIAVLGSGVGVFSYLSSRSSPADLEVPVPTPPASSIATVRVDLPPGQRAELVVDGKQVAVVSQNMEVPLMAGGREIALYEITTPPRSGGKCVQQVTLVGGKTTPIQCVMRGSTSEITTVLLDLPMDPPEASIPAGKPIDLSFAKAPIHDVIRFVGKHCGLNVVIPSSIQGPVTVHLAKVPCDQALEVLLESRGLWYQYRDQGRLLRIAPRVELDRDRVAQRERMAGGFPDDVLPPGGLTSLDFREASLRDVLQGLAFASGVNLVIPDGIEAKVTVRVDSAPWDRTFQTILAAHGLWYRYRENGKVVRIAPRVELDREDMAERERARGR